MMAMTLTSKTHPYKAGFEPFMSDVYRFLCVLLSLFLWVKYPACELKLRPRSGRCLQARRRRGIGRSCDRGAYSR